MKGKLSFTHEELKETAKVLRANADWLEEEFKDKEEPLNLSIICVVCNEDTGQARSTVVGSGNDLASSLASAQDAEAWGRTLMHAARLHQLQSIMSPDDN